MIRKSTIYLLLLLTSLFSPLTSVFAQKKQMAEAENYLRSGKNFDKAEQLMTKLLSLTMLAFLVATSMTIITN